MEQLQSAPRSNAGLRFIRSAMDVLLDPGAAFASEQKLTAWTYASFLLCIILFLSAVQWPYKQIAFHIQLHPFWQIVAATLVLMPVVSSLIVWLVYALLLWAVATFFGGKLTYGQALQITVMAATTVVLGAVVNVAALFAFTRPQDIDGPQALGILPNLNSFLHLHGRLAGGAAVFTPFSLWFFFLIAIGVARMTGMQKQRAGFVGALVCLAGVLISMGLHK